MASAYDLLLKIRGDASGADKALASVSKKMKKTGRSMTRAGQGLSKAVTLPILAFGALGVKKLAETQKQMAQTEAVIKSTGGAANVTAKQVGNLADSIAAKTGVDDDAIQTGENLLLTFKNIQNQTGKNNDIFNQATMAMTDMSVAMGQDTKSSAIMLGKALNDPTKGLAALSRVGVTFSKSQEEAIKKMQASGDTLGAQKLMLKELNSQFAGSAEAYGKTLPGALSKAKQALEETAMSIVQHLLPAFQNMLEFFNRQLAKLNALPAPMKKWIAYIGLAAAALGPLLIVMGQMVTTIGSLIGVMASVGVVTLGWVAAIVALGAILTVAYMKSEKFRTVVNAIAGAAVQVAKKIWGFVQAVRANEKAMAAIKVAIVLALGPVLALTVGIGRAIQKSSGLRSVIVGLVQLFVNLAKIIAMPFTKLVIPLAAAIVKSKTFQTVAKAMGTAAAAAFGKMVTWASKFGGWLDSILSKVGSAIGKVNELASAISKINPAKLGGKAKKLLGFADGGIATAPSIFGEAGPEMAIPLSAGKRRRALDLFRQTADILGAGQGGGDTINVYTNATDPEAVAQRILFKKNQRRLMGAY